MPRQPTGRPRGRPAGSGHLGEEGQGHTRLTVRIPQQLYDDIKDITYTTEAPDMAQTVRHALEHYLSYKRQTGNAPLGDTKRQTANVPLGDTKRQTGNVPAPVRTTADDNLKD